MAVCISPLALFTLLFVILLSSGGYASSCETFSGKVGLFQVSFLSRKESQKILMIKDNYTERLNSLNRALRLMVPREVSDVEFLSFIGDQAQCWNKNEIESILGDLKEISHKLNEINSKSFALSFKLVKTSGKEEGDAWYTRSDYIAVPQGKINAPTLTHEIFHIFTKKNPNIIDRLYALINFFPKHIEIPKQTKERIIINPDAPLISHFINVIHNNVEVAVVPIILSNVTVSQINPNDKMFFKYINISLFSLEDNSIIPVVETNYLDLVGRNTNYIIHPEEILADNFSSLVQNSPVEDQQLLQRLNEMLKLL